MRVCPSVLRRAPGRGGKGGDRGQQIAPGQDRAGEEQKEKKGGGGMGCGGGLPISSRWGLLLPLLLLPLLVLLVLLLLLPDAGGIGQR